jgi:ATP-dependent helicase/nuclease subunit B
VRRGELSDYRVLAELANIEAVSPSEVEMYTACPYRWFVDRRLQARAPDVQLDRMAAGRIAHAALASFYRRWIAQAPRVTSANVSEAARLAKQCATEAVAREPKPTGHEEARILAGIAPAVEALVVRDAAFLPDFRPAHHEWSFGLEDGDEAIDLGGVLVRGRADRVDIGPEGLVIIDYKRSSAPSLADMRRDALVQLPLYAAVASRRLGLPIAGGLYRSLAEDKDRGFVLRGVAGAFKPKDVVEREELDVFVERAVDVAREAVEGMRSGRVAPAPLKERCAFCSAAPFCPGAAR